MSDYTEYHEREWDFTEEMERKRNPLGIKNRILTAEDADPVEEEDHAEEKTID